VNAGAEDRRCSLYRFCRAGAGRSRPDRFSGHKSDERRTGATDNAARRRGWPAPRKTRRFCLMPGWSGRRRTDRAGRTARVVRGGRQTNDGQPEGVSRVAELMDPREELSTNGHEWTRRVSESLRSGVHQVRGCRQGSALHHSPASSSMLRAVSVWKLTRPMYHRVERSPGFDRLAVFSMFTILWRKGGWVWK